MQCEPTVAYAHEALECFCVLNGQLEWETACPKCYTDTRRTSPDGRKEESSPYSTVERGRLGVVAGCEHRL